MKKSLSVAAVLAVAAALVLGTAPAANAAIDPPVLPPAQTLYNIDCDDAAPQLWSFTTDGASTPIGAAGTGDDCAGGAQTSPVDGKTYLIYYDGETRLSTVDLTTGVISSIAQVNGATNGAWQLIITNSGAAFITNSTSLYTIDLTTATTTLVGSMAPFSPGAMAYDSLTDTIYGFHFGNTLAIYTIDRATGAATDTGHGGNWPVAACLGGGTGPGSPDGAVFDSNGIAWIQSDSCVSNIMAWDPVNNIAWMVGELYDATGTVYPTSPNNYYSETFFIAPVPQVKPALANTGVNYAPMAIAGGSAAVIVLAGIALLVVRRRRAGA
ncbi:MAG: hypothetical protein IT189_12220 [Microbacteriaceae bacterium]|nr:hypothetical protein [Microbacteriaceae bacterium]